MNFIFFELTKVDKACKTLEVNQCGRNLLSPEDS